MLIKSKTKNTNHKEHFNLFVFLVKCVKPRYTDGVFTLTTLRKKVHESKPP